jgi:hypothetical protein
MAVVMARKRKTAKERLRQEIKRVRSPTQYQLLNLLARTDPDWSDKRVRGAYANVALTLDGEPAHSSLRTAFQEFGLDPVDPFNWRRLLTGLAAIFFAPVPTRPRGARPKWDEPRRMVFKTDVARARKQLKESAKKLGERPPTDDDVAAYLHVKWPDRYPWDAATIRKYIVSGPPKGRR